jgi:predicted MFS family arabinose efflux permease
MKPSSNREKRALFYFLYSHFCTSLNFVMWRSVYNNFLHDVFSVTESQRGYLAAIREIPGLVTAIFAAGATSIAESAVGGIYILLISLGTLAFVFANQFWSLILGLLIMSTGVHLLMPIRSSISLSLGEEGAKARRLGQVGSIGAVASLAGAGYVILTVGVLKYDGVFIVASVVAAIGIVAMLAVHLKGGEIRRNRFAVKREYALYYVLSFLDACRRHTFVTFASYGLVKNYGVSAQMMAVLMFINHAANIYTRPMMGRLIDRFGERKMLMFSYSSLIVVFLGYAYIGYVPLLYVLYCLDNIFFGFSVAMTTYLDKIAPREDVMAGIAFGITLNHIAAIALLPVGGYMWGRYGYETPFLIGIGILILSLAASSRVRTVTSDG